MQLPTDTPPEHQPGAAAPFIDTQRTAPEPDLHEQRERDFMRVFQWGGKELTFSVMSEIYYRELRVHGNAPPLASMITEADCSCEAPRVLYVASMDLVTLRRLRLLPPFEQLAMLDQWIEQNIRSPRELTAATKVALEILDVMRRARSEPEQQDEGLQGMGN